MVKQAVQIELTDKQRKILENMERGSHTPLHYIERSHIILMAADGVGNRMISKQSGLNRQKVQLWRRRWAQASAELIETEKSNPQKLKGLIHAILNDEHRSGRPRYFSEDQVAEILTMACESPEDKGLPFSHWTPGMLARQAEKEGIVESISIRSVARFLKRSGFTAPSSQRLVESQH